MRFLCVLTLIFGSLVPLYSYANCPTGPPIVMGTIPSDGQVDVPINTSVVVFTQSEANATIDGVDLERVDRANVWRIPSNLEPNTSYEITFSLADDGGVRPELVVGFTTGSSESAEPAAPDVTGYQIVESSAITDADCREYVSKTGCPDQGDPEFVIFPTQDARDLLIVNTKVGEYSQLWPKSCGVPAWSGYGGACFDVFAFENGRMSSPTEVCGTRELGPYVDKGTENDGCSQTKGNVGMAILMMFGLVGLRRRFRA